MKLIPPYGHILDVLRFATVDMLSERGQEKHLTPEEIGVSPAYFRKLIDIMEDGGLIVAHYYHDQDKRRRYWTVTPTIIGLDWMEDHLPIDKLVYDDEEVES